MHSLWFRETFPDAMREAALVRGMEKAEAVTASRRRVAKVSRMRLTVRSGAVSCQLFLSQKELTHLVQLGTQDARRL